MKKLTVDIIKDLVALLTFTEEILACVVDVPNNEVTLTVCSTHGVVSKGCILIGGNDVKVIRVIGSTQLVISGAACPPETEIVIPAPNYYYGTLIATDEELSDVKKSKLKTPMVYFYQVSRERRNRNPAINLGRRADIVLFFLEDDARKGLLTEDRYKEYIGPMDNLVEDFVDLLENDPIIGDIESEDYTLINHSKAGFHDRVGHLKNLFSTELSGIEFRISLPINKNGCIECED